MKLRNPKGHIFIPDGTAAAEAVARTTRLCVAAHQDDVEIMAYAPIAECFRSDSQYFSAVVVTDGAGSPRAGAYASLTDAEMQDTRAKEQDEAAALGRYAAMLQLAYPSARVKSSGDGACAAEIAEIIRASGPDAVYTHNLADKHDTHVGVALRVIEAIRSLPQGERPPKLYGMEVWRGLDWADDGEKVPMDTSAEPELAEKILSVFASQCAGGKRYDLAALGRRLANATFYASHAVDSFASCSYALDMTLLIQDDSADIHAFLERQVSLLREDISGRLARMK